MEFVVQSRSMAEQLLLRDVMVEPALAVEVGALAAQSPSMAEK